VQVYFGWADGRMRALAERNAGGPLDELELHGTSGQASALALHRCAACAGRPLGGEAPVPTTRCCDITRPSMSGGFVMAIEWTSTGEEVCELPSVVQGCH
jgi:hypothetical protein